ncbi:MAG: hypothetical protein QMB08_00945 [Acidimicrobiales bacterium]
MNESEPQSDGVVVAQAAVSERPNIGIDLATRPDVEWLNTVQNDLNDTDLVLKCLARDSAKICQICDVAQAAGELDDRPMLARCAGTKQPR